MSYWLVGEAPHPTMDAADACLMPDDSTVMHTANLLLRLTGWTAETYLRVFAKRVYLWQHARRIWLGYGAERAVTIGEEAKRDGSSGVILLGEAVSQAFGLQYEPPLQWIGRYAVMPHPSACRFWKTPEAPEVGRAFFASLLDEAVLHR